MSPQVSFETQPRVAVVGGNRKLVSELTRDLEDLGLAVLSDLSAAQRLAPELVIIAAAASTKAQALIQEIENSNGLARIPRLGAFVREALTPSDVAEHFDDFIVLPCHPAELCARVRRLLQRARPAADEEAIVRIGSVTIDPERFEITVAGKRVALTYMEFQLLKHLVKNRGRVISREVLFREVWEQEHPSGMRTVDVHVRRLRAKLGTDFERSLQTVRKVGYRLATV